MISQSSWIWLGVCFLALVAAGWSGIAASRARSRKARAKTRVQAVMAEHHVQNLSHGRPLPSTVLPEASAALRALALFGASPATLEHSPAPWWIVLIIAIAAARLLAGGAVTSVGPIGWIVLPLAWIVLSRTYFAWALGRHRALLVRQFPDALAMIVRSLSAGIPVRGAIAAVAREAPAPTSYEFSRLADDIGIGAPLGEAARTMGLRHGLTEYRFFATAIGLQAQTGGGLTETLEGLASLIRKRLALAERGRALSSEARTSTMILGALPIVMGLLLWLISPGYIGVLVTDPAGQKMLALAVLLLAGAAVVMRSIIRKSLR